MDSELLKIYEDLTFSDASDSDVKRENANIDGNTSMGTMLKYGSEAAKIFYQERILKPEHARAHINGDIHIHDLDFLTLTTTCCQIDLVKLFKGGFYMEHGFIREPNDIQTYSALACIAIQSNQNDQHGGQSIPAFDYAMAPGVRKTYVKKYRENLGKILGILLEEMEAENSGLKQCRLEESDDAGLRQCRPGESDDAGLRQCRPEESDDLAREITDRIKEETGLVPSMAMDPAYAEAEARLLLEYLPEEAVKRARAFAVKYAGREIIRAVNQAMEAFIHNLNTMHSRAGAQIPFSSINYGTDTSPEGRLVSEAVMRAQEAGMGKGETPIFPIHIFKVKDGISANPGDPNYDLFRRAIKTSARRLFPNFSFLDAPFNKEYYREGDYNTEVAYMGCRTRVLANAYDPSRQVTGGRGNLSFTSLNLPRLAIEARGDREAFMKSLDDMISLVFDQLYERYKIQAARKVKNYPFLMQEGIWLDSDKLGPEDTVGEVLKHGTLTIGFIGLAECLKALTGKHHGESQEARELGLKIIGHIRERADAKTAETGMNYTVIATPAEGLSGRFLRLDRDRYGVIPGVTDREYYTNSFHVPVYYSISAFEKIKIEAPYHALTNGGHISYIEMDGDPLKNLDAFEAVVRCMKESGMGYGSINHPVDRDPVCGFTGIIDNECPQCGRREAPGTPKFERIRRITGYLVGTLDRFNDAKYAEVQDRVKHRVT